MGLVDGKVALVTGSAAGIGRATALKFAREGARVVVSDIDIEGGERTSDMIVDEGGEAIFIACDTSEASQVEALIDKTVARFGRLDCACNNAGIEGDVAPLLEQSIENYDRIMAVNARGTFLCMRAEMAQMLKTGGGAIVNLASIAGLVGFAGIAAYAASKHAVNGMTKNAALEYGDAGIRVNSVCPGGIDTRMLDSLAKQATEGTKDSHEMLDPMHPIGRIGRPQEVAEAIVWLCSPAAGFVTGVNMPVDGGYVAR